MNDSESTASRPVMHRCASCGRGLKFPAGTDLARCLPVCSTCRPTIDADRALRALVYLADRHGMTLAESLRAGDGAPFSVTVL